MAVSTGAFKTGSAKVNREELANVVDAVQRSDTPIYSMIANSSAKSVFPEWPVRDFDAPGQNIQSEGRDYAFVADNPSKRMGNHTQIFAKNGKFTNTQETVDNAAKSEQMARDKIEKGLALRTDVEFSIVTNNPSLGGDDRQSGSLSTWAETNVSRGAGGANGGYSETTKVTTAPTDGTQRALSKTLIDDLLQAGYSSGAKLTHMFFSPYGKRAFASLMEDPGVAQFRYAAKGGKNAIVATAEIYLGPLGQVTVHPNHVMGASATQARNAFVLDTKRVKWKWLRTIYEDKDLAKTGDYKQFVLQGEGCLCVENEKAVGVIADIYGLTATT